MRKWRRPVANMGDERPALGGEYEIALAKVNTVVDVTFNENPYPPIIGSFEVITCTRNIDMNPPSDQSKFLPCGYNPAAQVIPGMSLPGTLTFDGQDSAQANRPMQYNGVLCVARVRVKMNDTNSVVRTAYCSYYTPRINHKSGTGDDVGAVSGGGAFTMLTFA